MTMPFAKVAKDYLADPKHEKDAAQRDLVRKSLEWSIVLDDVKLAIDKTNPKKPVLSGVVKIGAKGDMLKVGAKGTVEIRTDCPKSGESSMTVAPVVSLDFGAFPNTMTKGLFPRYLNAIIDATLKDYSGQSGVYVLKYSSSTSSDGSSMSQATSDLLNTILKGTFQGDPKACPVVAPADPCAPKDAKADKPKGKKASSPAASTPTSPSRKSTSATSTSLPTPSKSKAGATGHSSGDGVRIRKGPSLDDSILRLVAKCEEFEIVERNVAGRGKTTVTNWTKVKVGSTSGYMASEYVAEGPCPTR